MKKIQYGKDVTLTDTNGASSRILKYFLTESPIGFGYSDLKSYGIEIERTDKRAGMQDMRECKSIDGIFYDVEDAITFLGEIKRNKIVPTSLSQFLENYIKDKVKKQRELNKVTQ